MRIRHYMGLFFLALILVSCTHMVFIAGGTDGNGSFLNNAELYDPVSKTFISASTIMSTGRMSATATTLANNTILVAGGQTSNNIMTGDIYTPSSNSFSITNGLLNHNRIAHTATYLDPAVVRGPLAEQVLLVGGDGFSRAGTAEIYSPASKTFFNTNNMLTPRTQHAAVLISHCNCSADGKVLVMGGYNNQSQVLASAELYDPATQTFTSTGAMHSSRFRHTATLLNNGNVLIAGGASQIGAKPNDENPALNTAELYDPRTGKFILLTNLMSSHRSAHAASLLQDGTVLITGGQDEHFIIENTAEIFNPTTNKFTALSSCNGAPPPAGCMHSGRDFHISQTLDDGTVLIAGGVDSNFQTLASAEIYSPATKTFTLTGSMSHPRSGASASMIFAGMQTRISTKKMN